MERVIEPGENDTTVVRYPSAPVVVTLPQVTILRYEPVAARLFGGGTSAVWPTGAQHLPVPEDAVLVSCRDEGTATQTSWR